MLYLKPNHRGTEDTEKGKKRLESKIEHPRSENKDPKGHRAMFTSSFSDFRFFSVSSVTLWFMSYLDAGEAVGFGVIANATCVP
jgi:hypothetical protein